MLISGWWHLCDDGIVRPVLRGEILAGDGSWKQARFLLDSGADRTVFSADILQALQLPPVSSSDRLGGVGGVSPSVEVQTQIVFCREDGSRITFRGQFAGFIDVAALDMSVLGRDIANLFAVIVDRPGDVVCLVGQDHRYVIQTK